MENLLGDHDLSPALDYSWGGIGASYDPERTAEEERERDLSYDYQDQYFGAPSESDYPNDTVSTNLTNLDRSLIVAGMNPEQTEAITLETDAGGALIVAGAGTGKTAVLTRRIAWLIANGVKPSNILAVTFTNKAAREMGERLEKLGVDPLPMTGTFHSIGLRILKRCPEAAGVRRGFTVMDQSDAQALWKRLFVLPKSGKPLEQGVSRDLLLNQDDQNVARFRDQMFALKEAGARSSKNLPSTDMNPVVAKMLDVYEENRKAQNMVDFSDLISGSLAAMREHQDGIRFAGRFSQLLVDEFQDTSSVQFEWVRAIADQMPTRNVFCVGDDCQSIYSFRGAVVENIGRFVREYNAREILLERNYRCGSDILDAANQLIAKNNGGDRKRLWNDSHIGQVSFAPFESDRDESDWIAKNIQRAGSANFSDTAILLRTKAAMMPVMSALRFHSIPHKVVGAKDFFDRKEVRDAVALVKLLLNPRDEASFTRVASAMDGVGKVAINKVIAESRQTRQRLIHVAARSDKLKPLSVAFDDSRFVNKPCVEIVRALIDDSGLTKRCLEDDDRERIKNITEFIALAGQFEYLGEFMEELTLFAEKKEDGTGVTLSTIHAAKGLEWGRVYLPALSEGHFPSVYPGDGALSQAEKNDRLEEERRLMYVALTRGKHAVTTSFAATRFSFGKIIDATVSRFVGEAGLWQENVRHRSAMRC